MDSQPKDDDELEFSRLSIPARDELYRTLARNFPNGAVLLFDRHLRYILADGAGLGKVGLSSQMLEGFQIHYHHVRPGFRHQLQSLGTILRFAHDLEIAFQSEEHPQTF